LTLSPLADCARPIHSIALEAPCADLLAVALHSDDRSAAEWLAEFLHPWFVRSSAAGEIHVTVSSDATAYAELRAQYPVDATRRVCFALDQFVVSLPAWSAEQGIIAADLKRSCFLVAAPRRIALYGDPTTRRWRFTLQLVFQEIAATRSRRSAIDLHAAAIGANGRAVAIIGAKRAGKTTLSFHLLRSGRCRWVSNDRAFVARDGMAGWTVRGMPTAVKIQPPALRDFPELARGLRNVDRPYLHAVDEIRAAGSRQELDASTEFALSPPQLARQLNVEPLASAPLAALVFPQIRPAAPGFAVERLEAADVREAICANLYGKPSGRQVPTLFEEIDGGASASPQDLAEALSGDVPGYRVVLGLDAYTAPDFATRLLAAVLP
jgi:hypothetical protein